MTSNDVWTDHPITNAMMTKRQLQLLQSVGIVCKGDMTGHTVELQPAGTFTIVLSRHIDTAFAQATFQLPSVQAETHGTCRIDDQRPATLAGLQYAEHLAATCHRHIDVSLRQFLVFPHLIDTNALPSQCLGDIAHQRRVTAYITR